MWIKVLRTQELCEDVAPLKAIAISSYNHRVQKCQEEVNKPENKANFIVVLYGNDANGARIVSRWSESNKENIY